MKDRYSMKKFFFILFAFFPGVSSAQEVVEYHPSTGIFAASIFEQAGYAAQNEVLTHLQTFFYAAAFFLIIASIVIVIYGYVVEKDLDGLPWLLIGPVIFSFAILFLTPGSAVEWRVMSNNVQGLERTEYNVSWLFHKFNGIISTISREMVRLITSNESMKVSKTFMSRQNLMRDLFDTRTTEPGFVAFASDALTSCNAEMDSARIIARYQTRKEADGTPEFVRAKNEYAKLIRDPNKTVQAGPAREYLTQLLENYPSYLWSAAQGALWDLVHNER
jgi:hypothetical protein